jgi:hypothetical protein
MKTRLLKNLKLKKVSIAKLHGGNDDHIDPYHTDMIQCHTAPPSNTSCEETCDPRVDIKTNPYGACWNSEPECVIR